MIILCNKIHAQNQNKFVRLDQLHVHVDVCMTVRITCSERHSGLKISAGDS